MKYFGRIFRIVLLLINILAAIMMIFSGYSPTLVNPHIHPLLSTTGLFFSIFLFINAGFVAFWVIFYWKYIIVSAVALLVCGSAIKDIVPFHFRTKEIPPYSIKVLSYNVMSFDNEEKDSSQNMNPMLNYIKNQHADIVCLQEFEFAPPDDINHLREKDIRKVLGNYPYYYTCLTNGHLRDRQAIFSKFPILAEIPIPYKSIFNGSEAYELDIRGKRVTLINNHLESNKLTQYDKQVYTDMIKNPSSKNVPSGYKLLFGKLADASKIRAAEADSVAKFINNCKNKYLIVCGDFNDSPISYTHSTIVEKLKDAHTESGFGFGISYNRNHFYFRIDNIMVSPNMTTFNCEVDNKIDASDHYPIWTYIAPF